MRKTMSEIKIFLDFLVECIYRLAVDNNGKELTAKNELKKILFCSKTPKTISSSKPRKPAGKSGEMKVGKVELKS